MVSGIHQLIGQRISLGYPRGLGLQKVSTYPQSECYVKCFSNGSKTLKERQQMFNHYIGVCIRKGLVGELERFHDKVRTQVSKMKLKNSRKRNAAPQVVQCAIELAKSQGEPENELPDDFDH